MALVLKRLGLEGEPGAPGQLAKIIGMPPYSEGSVSLIRRWIRGDHGPSFDYTMTLLSKAGLLTAEAERAWSGTAKPAAEAARAAAESAAEAEDQAARAGRAGRPRRGRQTG